MFERKWRTASMKPALAIVVGRHDVRKSVQCCASFAVVRSELHGCMFSGCSRSVDASWVCSVKVLVSRGSYLVDASGAWFANVYVLAWSQRSA